MTYPVNGLQGRSNLMIDSPMLITGETGEIGTVIKDIFAEKGIRLLAFDDYLKNKLHDQSPQRLLHLAGRADISRPDSILDSNIGYLRTVIGRAELAGVEELIFFSSVSVYGYQDKEDVNETDGMLAPQLYGLSKLMGEKILELSHVKTLCIRLPGVLELRKASNFLSRMFVRLQNNEDIIVYNADKIFNNFIDIHSIADFVSNLTVTEKFDVINIGNEKQLTISEIIELIRSTLNSRSKVVYADKYMPFFNLSIAKATSRYGFKPGNARDNIIRWCSQRLVEMG